MSPRKLLVLTAVVAILFAFIVLFERKMPSTAERQAKGELYWDLPEGQVSRLTLTRGTEALEFERKDPATPWRMVKPVAYPADDFAVNGALAELSDLKRSSEDVAEARPGDYGLDKPVAAATLVWADPDDPKDVKTRTVEFGSAIPGTDIVAARMTGENRVLFVPASALTAVRRNPDDFRSRDVFGGSAGDVTKIEILRGRGSMVFARRNGAWWLVEPVNDLADSAEADRLVGQLTGLRAREFVHNPDDLAAQGLNPPLFRVSLTGEKGAVTAVDFGAVRSDDSSVYARRDDQVLSVDRDIVDDLSREAGLFRSTALAAFDRSDVTAVEGAFGDARYELSRSNDGWTAAGGRAVIAPAADDLLSAILALKSRSFVDGGAARQLPEAGAVVTVRTRSGTVWTLTFHPRDGGLVARVAPRPGGFVVDREVPGRIEAAFKKALASPTPAPTKKP